MNYFERKNIINTTNDGNHINTGNLGSKINAEESSEIMVKCDGCDRMIEQFEHYRDGGLCFKCIERIGK